jgi:HSP20 family molecular chaperone IbpA
MCQVEYESETVGRADLHRRIEEFFNSSIFGFSTLPEVEIHETDAVYVMEVELHGLGENDVEVSIENNLLTIVSLRKAKVFQRSFIIPRDVDRENISILRDFRLLRLTFPRIPEECRAG